MGVVHTRTSPGRSDRARPRASTERHGSKKHGKNDSKLQIEYHRRAQKGVEIGCVQQTCTKGTGDHTRTRGEEGRPHQQRGVTRRGQSHLRGKNHRRRRVQHASSGAPWQVQKERERQNQFIEKKSCKVQTMTQPFIGNQTVSYCTFPAATTTSASTATALSAA